MATTPTLATHDLTLTDGSTTLGLVLARDKDKRPMLRRSYARTLADQQFQSLSDAAYDAETGFVITEDDRSGGFGKQYQTSGRYRQAFNVDASYPGIIVPSPVVVDTTQSTPSYATTTSITNGGFEAGDISSWTSVLGGGGTWAAQGGTVRTGSWAAACTVTGVDGAAEIKNTLTSADSSLFGDASTPVDITVVVYGRTTTAGAQIMTVTLRDASGTIIATATASVDSAGWTAATLNHVFTESWPKLVVHVSFPQQNYTVYLDDVSVTINAGVIQTSTTMGALKLVEYNGSHYAVGNTGVWKRTANNWARVAGSPDNIIDCMADGTSLHLSRGSGSTLKQVWAMNSSEVFTRCTGTGAAATPAKLAYVSGSMYGSTLTTTVYKYTSIAAAAVAATYTVGETGYNIESLINHLALPHVVTERQHDYIDASGTVIPSVTPQLFSLYDANTGRSATSWNGNLYYPAGAQSILEYDAGAIDSMGPARNAERLANFAGQVLCLAGDDEWLYAFVDNDTKIEVLKGRPVDGVWHWHPFLEETLSTLYWAGVGSLTAKRLWYSTGNGDTPRYIPLSTKYGDPLTDTALTFQTGGTFETCGYIAGTLSESKTFNSILFRTAGLSASPVNTITVKYWKAGDSGWTLLGTLNTSPSQELFFTSGGVSTTELWLQFTFNVASAATGIGLYNWVPRGVTVYKKLERFTARVVVGRNRLKNGDPDTEMTYHKLATQLHAWKQTHPLTLAFDDGTTDGLSFTVKLDNLSPDEKFLSMGNATLDGNREPQSEIDLVFVAQRTSA